MGCIRFFSGNSSRRLLYAGLSLLLTACHTATPTRPVPLALREDRVYYSGGDGSSSDEAVLFPAARSSSDGVPLERRWIGERFPGYQHATQRLVEHEGRLYDLLLVTTSDGEAQLVWFDMTSWFGRVRASR